MSVWNEYRRRLKKCDRASVVRLAAYLKVQFPSCALCDDHECDDCNSIIIERLIRTTNIQLPDSRRTFEK